MQNLRACLVVGSLALAACGGDGSATADASIDAVDAKVYEDAPPPTFDWSCEANKTPPSTASANVTLSGIVSAVSLAGGGSFAPLQGADVTVCNNGANCAMMSNQDGDDVSDAQGAWSVGPIATGGNALDDYIEMKMTGYRTTYAYPDAPFTGNAAGIPILTFDGTTAAALGFLGCDASQAIIGLALVDCAMAPITDSNNVMITIKQNGAAVTTATPIDASTFNAMAAGTFLVCGVPANATTEVSASYMSHTFVAHDVKTVANETTMTLLVPGY
jgi:hypothetical protein